MRRPRFGSPIGLLLLILLLPLRTHQTEAAGSAEQDNNVQANNPLKDPLPIDSGELDVNAALNYKDTQGESNDDLRNLYAQLEEFDCNRTIDTPLLRHLLNRSAVRLEQQNGEARLFFLAQLIARHTYLASQAMPLNGSLTGTPPARPNGRAPIHVLEASCDGETRRWTPVAIYPTTVANSFFQLRLPQLQIDACRDLNQCPNSKCSWTSHGELRVYARSCCNSETRFCRSDWRAIHFAFYCLSIIFALICLVMIPMVLRERKRQQQEARGWALMELFFFGAFVLYILPLIDWLELERSCVVTVWLREVGFTLFYGSVVLKIYRNLQEYRVRKAHHVIVREQDLLKYLCYGMAITMTSLIFWTLGSLKTSELYELQWPQCPFQKWTVAWTLFEMVILLYGLRLCYKARSSNWIERYQFSVAVILEIVVSLGAQLARYSLQHTGSSDAMFIIAVVQLHLTISVNIAGIITPKFMLNNTEINRRTVTMAGTNNSGRAHPSLAKLRDNLINGTLDFGDVPISEMNPEDVRAELKRVYTQLRMYKVKSIYQENPHISKRKGGKKVSDKTNKNRRISIPPATSSPKVRRVDEEDEKSDLTVESSAVLNNRLLLSTNKIQLESNDQQHSVRV